MNLTDIHTHILFGMDDGAKTPEAALEMLRTAYDSGTRAVFFTPHNVRAGFASERARDSLSVLMPEIRRQFPDLKVYGGCEIMFSPSALESVLTGELPTLADSAYILVEFMPGAYYGEILAATRNTVSRGLIPVIAHAERYMCLRKEGTAELVKNGALIQLNAKSVSGKRGLSTKLFCKSLIKKGLVHFIATDAHDGDRRNADLGECAKYVEKKFGKEVAERIFCENPKMIIENK